MLDNGLIVETGKYNDLLNLSNGQFTKFTSANILSDKTKIPEISINKYISFKLKFWKALSN